MYTHTHTHLCHRASHILIMHTSIHTHTLTYNGVASICVDIFTDTLIIHAYTHTFAYPRVATGLIAHRYSYTYIHTHTYIPWNSIHHCSHIAIRIHIHTHTDLHTMK